MNRSGSMMSLRRLCLFCDPDFWRTATLIARSGVARQYRNSFLGVLWTMLQPASTALIYAIVMPIIGRLAGRDYVVYILVSIPAWGFISSCLIAACNSVIANGETLKRCTINPIVFPIADVLRNVYTSGVAFAMAYGVCLLLGMTHLDATLLWLPVYFLPTIVIMMAMGISIAFLAPYFRDLLDILVNLLQVAFWLTPIVYTPALLPEQGLKWLKWNPFYLMIAPIQDIAYRHRMPDADNSAALLVLVVISLLIAVLLYRRCGRNYVFYL